MKCTGLIAAIAKRPGAMPGGLLRCALISLILLRSRAE
jgi:hypothetical protein